MAHRSHQALLSSPDPLNHSPTLSSPEKPRRSTPGRQSLPLRGISPRKQTFELDVGNKLSPQKIRVTVEADDTDKENVYQSNVGAPPMSPSPNYGPNSRRKERTVTTTVPLKGLSDTDDDTVENTLETPKRARGRPRKSAGTPVASKTRRRIVTPSAKQTGRRRRTLGDLVDGDDEEDWDFQIGAGVEVRRGKGRSKSRSIRSASRVNSFPASVPQTSPERIIPSTTKSRGRRKKLVSEEVHIHEDEAENATLSQIGDQNEIQERNCQVLVEVDPNRMTSPVEVSNTMSAGQTSDDIQSVATAHSSSKRDFLGRRSFPTPKGASIVSPETSLTSSTDPSPHRESTPKSSVLGSTALIPGIDDATPSSGDFYGANNPFDRHLEHDSIRHDLHQFADEAQYDAGKLPEFDTILESEGFSMISVDSVPSLREHLSSPDVQAKTPGTAAPPAVGRSVLSTRSFDGVDPHDSFSSVASEILDAATPGIKLVNTNLLFVKGTLAEAVEDSFSSIPPEILEAATPGRKRQNESLFAMNIDTPAELQVWSSRYPSTKSGIVIANESEETSVGDQQQIQMDEGFTASESLLLEPADETRHYQKQNDSLSRLLTPEETPSPNENTRFPEYQSNGEIDDEHPGVDTSLYVSHMESSPPMIPIGFQNQMTEWQQKPILDSGTMETPSIIFSSPSLPLPKHSRLSRADQSSSHRVSDTVPKTSLSPIVRAGQALQEIMVPSSSSGPKSSLRSPFKSPSQHRQATPQQAAICRSPQSNGIPRGFEQCHFNSPGVDSVTEFSADTRRGPRRGMRLGDSLPRARQSSNKMNRWGSIAEFDDPFTSSNPVSHSPPAQEQKQTYSLGVLEQDRLALSLSKTAILETDTVRFNSGLISSVGYNLPGIPNQQYHIGSVNDQYLEDKHVGPYLFETTPASDAPNPDDQSCIAAVTNQQAKLKSVKMNEIIDTVSNELPGSEADYDDDNFTVDAQNDFHDHEDIWQAEARHYSSQPANLFENESTIKNKPRRSNIPSPWRKNSRGLVYGNEVAQLSPPPQKQSIKDEPGPKLSHDDTNACQYSPPSSPPENDSEDQEESVEMSSLWHIPQKRNFTPRPRLLQNPNIDITALLGSSPVKFPAALTMAKRLFLGPVTPFPKTIDRETPDSPAPFSSPSSHIELDLSLAASCRKSPVQMAGIESPKLATAAHAGKSISQSPRKSCLRNNSTSSPSKNVAFSLISAISSTPSLPAIPAQLSGTSWSKAHWKLLNGIYKDFKINPETSRVDASYLEDATGSKYLDKRITAQGTSLVLEEWHLAIVAFFRDEVPGWEEGVVAKRLFALLVDEDRKASGNV